MRSWKSARIAIALMVSAFGLVGVAAPAGAAPPPDDEPTLFVLRGEATVQSGDIVVTDKKIGWLADRPARDAGYLDAKQFDEGWDRWGFDAVPPNAAISGDDVDVVVELTNPRVDGAEVRFDTVPIRGTLPKGDLGTVSVFVDPTAAQSYSLTVENNSPQMQTFYLYQAVEEAPQGSFPLAWFAQFSYPNTSIIFTWDTSYGLSWGETGSLQPGVSYNASQSVPAQPGSEVTLTDVQGSLQFTNQSSSGPPSALTVECDATVPMNQAAVAVEMSGAPTLAVPAQPNFNLQFPTALPAVFLAAGPFIQQGQVLEPDAITMNVELSFQQSTSLRATLNADNTWTVAPA